MEMHELSVAIPSGEVTVAGDLVVPDGTTGVVIFAHGSGSSRHSSRNRRVAADLNAGGITTLLMDLLTVEEEEEERFSRHLRFDIGLLSGRLEDATRFVSGHELTAGMPVGLFGASTGAAAALVAAAALPEIVRAVVSRGGRPDLATTALPTVRAPTLLIVGGEDLHVLDLNREAAASMTAEVRLEIVPGATHLFPEPGALEAVVDLALAFFRRHLETSM